jgi:hypothetical protein
VKGRRRQIAVVAFVVLVASTQTPGAGLFWMLCGTMLLAAAWRVPESVLHRKRQLQWEAALERSAEGWPTSRDRFLIRLDRIYRGGAATFGVFLILYGLLCL